MMFIFCFVLTAVGCSPLSFSTSEDYGTSTGDYEYGTTTGDSEYETTTGYFAGRSLDSTTTTGDYEYGTTTRF